jgi:alpha-beta hydrolase superfamily lysophospholipase
VALDIVGALVSEARTLPGVRSDRVALFGHSRGGAAALYYVLETGGVQALVLNSTGYPKLVVDRASAVSAPLLLLHGTADGPGDGSRGNERTAFANVGPFVAALQKYEKPFEKKYFDGAGHNGLFTDEKQHDETVKLVAAFLRKELAK